jgi:predicted RNA-binding Zn ribbon-like protein
VNSAVWPASDDFRIDAAPGALGFVHDLMNTVAGGKPNRADLLGGLDSAQQWLDTALANLADATGEPRWEIELTEDDLDGLRALRADLRHVAGGRSGDDGQNAVPVQTSAAALQLSSDGRVALRPRGTGVRLLTSITLSVILRAQLADTWRRVKLCRNPKCAAIFYDRSRNNSGVWHDVRVCGNAVNLRASRARRNATRAATT